METDADMASCLLMTDPLRALIVDDSLAAREVAEASLEAVAERLGLDFDIEKVENGLAALKVLATSDIDFLIVDLHMPDIHGLEVLSFWHQRDHVGARFAVVVSTAVSAHDKEKAMGTGASAFLEKPLSGDALAPIVASFNAGGPEQGDKA